MPPNSFSQNDATRVINNVIDERIRTLTSSGAGIDITWGSVAYLESAYTCSVYLFGDVIASSGFRLDSGMKVNVLDPVRVAIDRRGNRWVEAVMTNGLNGPFGPFELLEADLSYKLIGDEVTGITDLYDAAGLAKIRMNALGDIALLATENNWFYANNGSAGGTGFKHFFVGGNGIVIPILTADPAGANGENAQIYYNSTTDDFRAYRGGAWTNLGAPSGTITMYGGSAAPAGYLLCDGASYLRATYANLFTAIGTTFGTADGTHFNVPDMRQKFPIGKAASGTGSTLGGTGGAIDHTHTGPSHTHDHATAHTHLGGVREVGSVVLMWDHSLGASSNDSATMASTSAAVSNAEPLTGASNPGTSDAGGVINTGTGNPPFLSVNFIIKT